MLPNSTTADLHHNNQQAPPTPSRVQSHGHHCWQKYGPTVSLTISSPPLQQQPLPSPPPPLSPQLPVPSPSPPSTPPAKRTRKTAKHRPEAELLQNKGDVIELHLSPFSWTSLPQLSLSPSPSSSSLPFQPSTLTPPHAPELVLPASEMATLLQQAMPLLPANPLWLTGDHPQPLELPPPPSPPPLRTASQLGWDLCLCYRNHYHEKQYFPAGSAISNGQCMFYLCKPII
jgi:hypothetical protein